MCDHKRTTSEWYAELMLERHDDFFDSQNKLVLNPELPHVGASPDGIVCCTCCGRGALEILSVRTAITTTQQKT